MNRATGFRDRPDALSNTFIVGERAYKQ
jgi:hypothetical protein